MVSGPQPVPLPSPAHPPAGQGPCYRPVGQREGSSRWRGNMGAAPGSDKGGMTQGPEGHERCLQRDDVRVMLPQRISTAMWPLPGMWQPCLDSAVGLCCQSSAGLAQRRGLGEHSGVPLALCLSLCQPCLYPQAPGELRSSSPRPCTRRSVTAQRGRSRRGLVAQVGVGPPWRHICRTLSPGPNAELIP